MQACLFNVKREQWADFILGLLTHLNINQTELSIQLGYKKYYPHLCSCKTGKRIPSNLMKKKLFDIAQDNCLYSEDLINVGQLQRKGIYVNGKYFPLDEAQLREDINGPLVEGEYINSQMLFPHKINERRVQFIQVEDSAIVFYKNSCRAQSIPLILPKKIRITDPLLVGLGIYLGEGTRTQKHKPKITNSEPKVIEQALAFFESIGIDKSHLSSWLQLHEYSKISAEKAKEFWERQTGLKVRSIWKKKKTGSKIIEVKQYGALHIELMRTLARPFIDNLIENAELLARSIPNGIKYLLQGWFAAEGCVKCRSSGSVREVSFTSLNPKDRALVRSLLSELGVAVARPEYRGTIKIHGYKNVKKLVELDIFKYHPLRKRKLDVGYTKFVRIPGANKSNIIDVLQDKEPLCTEAISKLVSLKPENTFKHLHELQILGKVKVIPGTGSIQNRWFI